MGDNGSGRKVLDMNMFQVYYVTEVLNIVKGNLGIINKGWNEYGRVLIQLNAG